MSSKAWADARREFRRDYIGDSRAKAKAAVIAREDDIMRAFNAGFLQGYNASNTMWQKKTKEMK